MMVGNTVGEGTQRESRRAGIGVHTLLAELERRGEDITREDSANARRVSRATVVLDTYAGRFGVSAGFGCERFRPEFVKCLNCALTRCSARSTGGATTADTATHQSMNPEGVRGADEDKLGSLERQVQSLAQQLAAVKQADSEERASQLEALRQQNAQVVAGLTGVVDALAVVAKAVSDIHAQPNYATDQPRRGRPFAIAAVLVLMIAAVLGSGYMPTSRFGSLKARAEAPAAAPTAVAQQPVLEGAQRTLAAAPTAVVQQPVLEGAQHTLIAPPTAVAQQPVLRGAQPTLPAAPASKNATAGQAATMASNATSYATQNVAPNAASYTTQDVGRLYVPVNIAFWSGHAVTSKAAQSVYERLTQSFQRARASPNDEAAVRGALTNLRTAEAFLKAYWAYQIAVHDASPNRASQAGGTDAVADSCRSTITDDCYVAINLFVWRAQVTQPIAAEEVQAHIRSSLDRLNSPSDEKSAAMGRLYLAQAEGYIKAYWEYRAMQQAG